MDEQYIKEQFAEVIRFSQNIQEPKLDQLFDSWRNKKDWFLKLNNGEPIYEYPEEVSFELPKEEKEKKINDFIDVVSHDYHNSALADFLYYMRDCFFSNLTNKDYLAPNKKMIKAGTKIVRAFKYFISDKALRVELQNKASCIIQEDKITGILCISVHPLDFLSSSENRHNWRSCHALDGEYRAGNLSYMTDESTVMVYLRSTNNQMQLPNFPSSVPWNSKKWRVLLFFSNDKEMLYLGRQYPFSAENSMNIITQQLLPKIGLKGWTEWSNFALDNLHLDSNIYFQFDYKYIPVGRKLIPESQLIQEHQNALNYNDLLHSTYYTAPYYCYRKYDFDNDSFLHMLYYAPHFGTNQTRFIIGGPVPCLCCEKEILQFSGKMACEQCCPDEEEFTEETYTCSCCGATIYEDEGVYLSYIDDWICYDCAEENLCRCDKCGEVYLKTDLVYDKKTNQYICPVCELRTQIEGGMTYREGEYSERNSSH